VTSRGAVRGAALAPVAALGLGLLAPASAQDPERLAMSRVFLTTDPTAARGCSRIGAARDDSLKDLRRKIVRVGGNLAVLSFEVDDLSAIRAEVFLCPAGYKVPRPEPQPPPPPPPGPPPPPPPGVPR
jgi:hypothetical protein